ncbi:MAG: serine--tRNA ligase [Patescibacteria group bacterium]
MLDIQFIRDNPEKVKKGVSAKQLEPKLVDKVLELDKRRRHLILEVEDLRARRNEIAKKKPFDSAQGKKVKVELQKKEPGLKKVEEEYKQALYKVPNLAANDVLVGKNESDNKVLRKWGEPKKFDFKPKDHLDLGEALDIIDVKRAAKVSGTRFGYLKGDAVLLEFALIQFALETLTKKGFTPIIPPVLIKKESMSGMGYLEHGGEEDMYVLEKDNLVLVGTSEQSIGPMHQGETFSSKDLPKRYVAFSPCFRREAGSYGKDTRGILRVHQFDKVEMFSYTRPDDSEKEHKYLLELEEKLFKALEIPYQVVKMCTGDLGAPAASKIDLEAWMPGQNKYREVTSASNTTDFQARRLNIKYQGKGLPAGRQGKTEYVHTLNGTAFAIGRTIIAILENYQQKDGSVIVPKMLQKWVGKEKI